MVGVVPLTAVTLRYRIKPRWLGLANATPLVLVVRAAEASSVPTMLPICRWPWPVPSSFHGRTSIGLTSFGAAAIWSICVGNGLPSHRSVRGHLRALASLIHHLSLNPGTHHRVHL